MKTKSIFNVKTALCAIMLAAVTLTSCKKDKEEDNTPKPPVLGMVQELKTQYLGKKTAEIKAAMAAIGYTFDEEKSGKKLLSYTNTAEDIKAYSFDFDKEVTDESAKVKDASYGFLIFGEHKCEAYLSQFEVWGEECNDLGYNAEYNGEILDKSYGPFGKEFTERAAFKTDYNAKKGTLIFATEEFTKGLESASSVFFNDVTSPIPSCGVMVTVGIEELPNKNSPAISRSSRLTKRN
ncbi:MAG: hypothetical protein ACRC3G_08205 [Bacteroidales bacterium]